MAYADILRSALIDWGDVATLLEDLLAETGYFYATGAKSTTSTSYTAYGSDSASLSVAAGETVIAIALLAASHSAANGSIGITIEQDGVDASHDFGIAAHRSETGGNDHILPFIAYFTPSAGTRTYKIKWKTTSGTIYSTKAYLLLLKVRTS